MNVVVFGATGPTGLLIVERALAEGHGVTAFVRGPAKLTVSSERLSAFQGDVCDESAVERAIDGADAVICSVGVPCTRKPVAIYSTTARHIIRGMSAHHVRRLVTITSGGTHPGRDPVDPFFFERILKPIFHTLYDDMREMERTVMAFDLDWTILRSSRLLNKPPTGRIRIGIDEFALKNGSTISRADLAEVVVKQLQARELVGHAPAVAD